MQPGSRLGPYEIVAQIGAGGMGEVYRARDTRLGRDVAIKVLPPEFAEDPERLRRFEQEARAVAALSHPNVLALFDVGSAVVSLRGAAGPEAISAQTPGLPRPPSGLAVTEGEQVRFLVTELLEGESLRDRLKAGGLTVRKAVETGVQIAQGLAAAHEKGIVHRDLKPGNVFVTKDGQVKILDFGLARLAQPEIPSDPHATTLPGEPATESGAVLGTMGYTSPEQMRRERADARSDIFAFGCVLYEMLAGKSPFLKATGAETVTAIMSEDPAPLSGTGRVISPTLQGIVRRCLEKRAEDRFGSARDVAFALEAITGETEPPATGRPRGSWLARHGSGLAGAGIAVAVVTALAIWQPWHAVSKPAGSVAERIPSILALPCKVLGSPESAYLTDAVPSTISTLLGEVQGMDTKVPPTSFEVERVHGDLDKIADAYGVQTFVLSTATAEGDHLIFNIQLADARTRKVRWSHQYQGSTANYTAMAHEAAQGICKAVLPDAAHAVPTSSFTSNSEAELAFQQGKYYANRYSGHAERTDFDRALAALNRALEADPKSATVAAWIAQLYGIATLSMGQIPRAQGLAEAEVWLQKALVLDPQCSQAWADRAFLECFKLDADLGKQIELSLKAAQLGPKNPRALTVFAIAGLASGGSLLLTFEALRESVRQDPLNVEAYSFLAEYLARFGRPEEALPVLDTVISLDPGNNDALAFKVYVLAEVGRTKEAATILKSQDTDRLSKEYLGARVQDYRWLLSLAADDDRDARSSLKAIMIRFADPAVDWNTLQEDIHILLPAVNRRFGKDAALDLLILSTKRGATMPYDTLMLRPDMKAIREDPRAKDVIQKTKVSFDLLMRILEDARARGELPKYLEKPMDDLLRQLKEHGAWTG